MAAPAIEVAKPVKEVESTEAVVPIPAVGLHIQFIVLLVVSEVGKQNAIAVLQKELSEEVELWEHLKEADRLWKVTRVKCV